jgi:hypothetical protein
MSNETPEQLLNAFKAAALSVTKLYKTSVTAQTKARSDGYQDCLDDLLTFLDREKIGEAWKIRKWVSERQEGRSDAASAKEESDDDVEKVETASSPEIHRVMRSNDGNRQRSPAHMRMDSAPANLTSPSKRESEEPEIVVPVQDVFSFRSTMPYPSAASLNMQDLDLSDAAARGEVGMASSSAVVSTPRTNRSRHVGNSRRSANLGRGAGSKRKLNFAEIFDLASLGYGKDMFGSGPGNGKRSRHA